MSRLFGPSGRLGLGNGRVSSAHLASHFASRCFSRRSRRGIALLATMWLSVAIAAVSLAFSLEAKQDRIAKTNLAQSTQAWAAARAGVATALSRLDRLSNGLEPSPILPVDQSDPWQWADTLVSERGTVGTARYEVHVRDAGAEININQASEDDWRNFLSALNVDYGTADRLAQCILDWRQPGDDPRANGAKRNTYISAGRVVLPTYRNFSSITELRDVMGMTPAIYKLIEPYISVAASGRVSVNTAPYPVLRMIPQFTDDVVGVILAQRSQAVRITSLQQLARMAGGAQLTSAQQTLQSRLVFTTQTAEITGIGWSPDGRTRVVSTMTVYRGTPIAQVQWRRDE